MNMLLTATDYDALLFPDEKQVVLDWFDRVCPGRLVLTLEVLAEGVIRLQTCTNEVEKIEIVTWDDPSGGEVVSTAAYVSDDPPQCIFEMLKRRCVSG